MSGDSQQTVGDLGEDPLVSRLTHLLGEMPRSVLTGCGDDCAVIAAQNDSNPPLLLKVDTLVEGAHYLKGEDPERAGRKALCRALSDIAAMGGEPIAALTALATPAETPVATIEGLYRGLTAAASSFGSPIVGGETSALPAGSPTLLSITLLGQATRPVLRSGGKPGDALFVTGTLGGSFASGHHLDFSPRLAEGQWLARHPGVHALMDLSDGLTSDLPRLSAASDCHHRIDEHLLPLRPGCSSIDALRDGEDYELLIAIEPAATAELELAWSTEFPELALTRIGELTGKDVSTEDGPLAAEGGWDTFRDSPESP